MPYQQDAFGNLVYVPSAGERMRGTHAPPDDLPGDDHSIVDWAESGNAGADDLEDARGRAAAANVNRYQVTPGSSRQEPIYALWSGSPEGVPGRGNIYSLDPRLVDSRTVTTRPRIFDRGETARGLPAQYTEDDFIPFLPQDSRDNAQTARTIGSFDPNEPLRKQQEYRDIPMVREYLEWLDTKRKEALVRYQETKDLRHKQLADSYAKKYVDFNPENFPSVEQAISAGKSADDIKTLIHNETNKQLHFEKRNLEGIRKKGAAADDLGVLASHKELQKLLQQWVALSRKATAADQVRNGDGNKFRLEMMGIEDRILYIQQKWGANTDLSWSYGGVVNAKSGGIEEALIHATGPWKKMLQDAVTLSRSSAVEEQEYRRQRAEERADSSTLFPAEERARPVDPLDMALARNEGQLPVGPTYFQREAEKYEKESEAVPASDKDLAQRKDRGGSSAYSKKRGATGYEERSYQWLYNAAVRIFTGVNYRNLTREERDQKIHEYVDEQLKTRLGGPGGRVIPQFSREPVAPANRNYFLARALRHAGDRARGESTAEMQEKASIDNYNKTEAMKEIGGTSPTVTPTAVETLGMAVKRVFNLYSDSGPTKLSRQKDESAASKIAYESTVRRNIKNAEESNDKEGADSWRGKLHNHGYDRQKKRQGMIRDRAFPELADDPNKERLLRRAWLEQQVNLGADLVEWWKSTPGYSYLAGTRPGAIALSAIDIVNTGSNMLMKAFYGTAAVADLPMFVGGEMDWTPRLMKAEDALLSYDAMTRSTQQAIDQVSEEQLGKYYAEHARIVRGAVGSLGAVFMVAASGGGLAPLAATFFASTSADGYAEAKNLGRSTLWAISYGTLMGAAEVAPMLIGAKFLKMPGFAKYVMKNPAGQSVLNKEGVSLLQGAYRTGFKKFFKDYSKTVTDELMQEISTAIMQQMTTTAFGIDPEGMSKEQLSMVVYEAAVGTMVATLIGSGGSGIRARAQQSKRQKAVVGALQSKVPGLHTTYQDFALGGVNKDGDIVAHSAYTLIWASEYLNEMGVGDAVSDFIANPSRTAAKLLFGKKAVEKNGQLESSEVRNRLAAQLEEKKAEFDKRMAAQAERARVVEVESSSPDGTTRVEHIVTTATSQKEAEQKVADSAPTIDGQSVEVVAADALAEDTTLTPEQKEAQEKEQIESLGAEEGLQPVIPEELPPAPEGTVDVEAETPVTQDPVTEAATPEAEAAAIDTAVDTAIDTAVDDAAAPVEAEVEELSDEAWDDLPLQEQLDKLRGNLDEWGVSKDGTRIQDPEWASGDFTITVEEAQEALDSLKAEQREHEQDIERGELSSREDRSDDIARLKDQIEIAKQRRGDTDQVAPVDTAESLDAKPDDELRAQAEGLGIKHRGLSRAAIIEKILEAPTTEAAPEAAPEVAPEDSTEEYVPEYEKDILGGSIRFDQYGITESGLFRYKGDLIDAEEGEKEIAWLQREAQRRPEIADINKRKIKSLQDKVRRAKQRRVAPTTTEAAPVEAEVEELSDSEAWDERHRLKRGMSLEEYSQFIRENPEYRGQPLITPRKDRDFSAARNDVKLLRQWAREKAKQPAEAAEGEASLDVQDTWGTDPRVWTEEQKEQKESSGLDRAKGDERLGVPESATIVTPESEAGQEAVAFGRALGVDVVFVSDLGTVASGLSVEHRGKPTGVVLVNARTRTEDTAIWAVVAHEIAHSTGIDRLVTELPRDQMEALIKKYLATFPSKPGADAVKAKLAADPESAHREAVAMFVTEFLADPKVRNEILKSNPSLAARILEFVMEVLQKAGIKLDTFTPAQQRVIKELRNKIIPGTPDMADILSRVKNLTDKDLNKEVRDRQLGVVGQDRTQVEIAVAKSIMAEQQAALRELDPEKAAEKIQSTGNPVTEDADILSEEEEEALMRELYGLTEATTEEAAPSSEGLNLEYEEDTGPVEPSEGLPENWEDLPKREKIKVIKRYVKRFIDAQPDTIKEILTHPEFIDQFGENKEYNKAIRDIITKIEDPRTRGERGEKRRNKKGFEIEPKNFTVRTFREFLAEGKDHADTNIDLIVESESAGVVTWGGDTDTLWDIISEWAHNQREDYNAYFAFTEKGRDTQSPKLLEQATGIVQKAYDYAKDRGIDVTATRGLEEDLEEEAIAREELDEQRGEGFELEQEPASRVAQDEFEDEGTGTQDRMFRGMDALPGQEDLFDAGQIQQRRVERREATEREAEEAATPHLTEAEKVDFLKRNAPNWLQGNAKLLNDWATGRKTDREVVDAITVKYKDSRPRDGDLAGRIRDLSGSKEFHVPEIEQETEAPTGVTHAEAFESMVESAVEELSITKENSEDSSYLDLSLLRYTGKHPALRRTTPKPPTDVGPLMPEEGPGESVHSKLSKQFSRRVMDRIKAGENIDDAIGIEIEKFMDWVKRAGVDEATARKDAEKFKRAAKDVASRAAKAPAGTTYVQLEQGVSNQDVEDLYGILGVDTAAVLSKATVDRQMQIEQAHQFYGSIENVMIALDEKYDTLIRSKSGATAVITELEASSNLQNAMYAALSHLGAELKSLTQRKNELVEKGEGFTSDEALAIDEKINHLHTQLQKYGVLNRAMGSVFGRGLEARKRRAYTYTWVDILMSAAAKKGEVLTPEETADLRGRHEKLKGNSDRTEKARKAKTENEADEAIQAESKPARTKKARTKPAQTKKTKTKVVSPEIRDQVNRIKELNKHKDCQ